MALGIVWTKQAVAGFEGIIHYLSTNFTEKEVRHFVKQTRELVELIADYPELLQQTRQHKNLRRGPINKQTMITYRVKPRKRIVEIINIRPARKKPAG